ATEASRPLLSLSAWHLPRPAVCRVLAYVSPLRISGHRLPPSADRHDPKTPAQPGDDGLVRASPVCSGPEHSIFPPVVPSARRRKGRRGGTAREGLPRAAAPHFDAWQCCG